MTARFGFRRPAPSRVWHQAQHASKWFASFRPAATPGSPWIRMDASGYLRGEGAIRSQALVGTARRLLFAPPTRLTMLRYVARRYLIAREIYGSRQHITACSVSHRPVPPGHPRG